MDNLSIQDRQGAGMGPPPMAQLPPQLFTTAASLLELTDKKVLVSVRDGRKLLGILRSWDQYGNLVLQSTVERRYIQRIGGGSNTGPSHLYSDEEKGLYLVRGENIIMIGEIDLDRDETPSPAHFTAVTPRELAMEEKRQEPVQQKKDALRSRKLRNLGFEEEHRGDIIF